MALSAELVGMHFRYPHYYLVEREKVREYARAVHNDHPAHLDESAAAELGHPGVTAPLTFISMLSYVAQRAMFDAADIVLSDRQIVQVDQVIRFARPITDGDRLHCDVYVEEVRHAHGTDIIVNKVVVTNSDGETLQETYTTLAGRSEGEGGSGFNNGAA